MKNFKNIFNFHLSIGAKLGLSLASIAVTLLVSCVISVLEYTRMDDYVSTLISEDINSINAASKLAEMSNSYNLQVLSVIGEDSYEELPEFDSGRFSDYCNSLKNPMLPETVAALADSVMYSYTAYMLTSMELENVLESSFIDSRDWYFERLQPRYDMLHGNLGKLSEAIYDDLEKNSSTFDRGFYRSIIPGIVAVGVGLLLILMLLFFLMAYYVQPVYKMLDSMNAYRENDKTYSYKFEGDDQLVELNSGISEIVNENQQLRKRIFALRSKK